jgi:hypothetical protein
MRTLPRILALSAALALAAPSLPSYAQSPAAPAAAPTKAQQQEAATRFKKGLELFKDGDYQAALIEFRRANELAPNYNVLYNIGQVYFQLQDYPGALSALERYLNEGGASIPASRRADVVKDIEKLKARVANIEITTTVPDADVTIDDVPVGRSPLPKPVMVSAGRHKISVSKVGFTSATKIVEVASGDSPKILVEPVEQKTALPVGPVEPPRGPVEPPPLVVDNNPPLPPPPPAPPPRSAPVPGIVVTSILTVGAVVTGALALSASSALKNDRASASATHDQLTSDATKTTALAVATDVMTGGAIIAFGVTLYVGLRTPAATPASPLSPAKPATGGTQIRFGVTGNGMRVLGTF